VTRLRALRATATAAIAAAATLTLAACGSSGGGSPAGGTTTQAGSTQAADAGFPVTVKTRYGQVTIPAEPTRVVALSTATADELLSLGLTPIKVAGKAEDVAASTPWLVDDLKGLSAPDMLNADYEVNVEAVAKAKPDLIVGQGYEVGDKAVFDQLNSIAPTVVPDSTDLNVSWDVRLRSTAAAVDKSAQAEQLIAKLKQEFADDAAGIPDLANKTYQWIRIDATGYGFGNGSLLELYGLKPAANQDNTMTKPALSLEKTADLNADLLAVWAPTPELKKQIDDDKAFQALPAVKNGTVLYADLAFATAINTPAPKAMQWVLDKLKPVITELGK
jgi:iron complex transport system substrate-binding protein